MKRKQNDRGKKRFQRGNPNGRARIHGGLMSCWERRARTGAGNRGREGETWEGEDKARYLSASLGAPARVGWDWIDWAGWIGLLPPRARAKGRTTEVRVPTRARAGTEEQPHTTHGAF